MLFALAMSAQKHDGSFVTNAAGTLACSEDEALGRAIKEARARWSQEKGWYSHSAVVTCVPDNFIRAAYEELTTGEKSD